MEATWISRDLPVLTAVVELYEEQLPSSTGVGRREVAERTSLSDDDVDRAIIALVEDGFIEWKPNRGDDRIMSWRVVGVSGRARRLVGQWPSPDEFVERIVAALNAAAEAESDPEKRSKLKTTAVAIGSFAKDLVTNVAANIIAGGVT